MKTQNVTCNLSDLYLFQKEVNTWIDKALMRYVQDVAQEAKKIIPIDREAMRRRTGWEKVGTLEYQLYTDTTYAEEQHDEVRYHYGKPSKSISRQFKNAKSIALNELQKTMNTSGIAITSKEKDAKKYYSDLKTKDNEKYNYRFGYMALKGYQWKNEALETYAQSQCMGKLIKYKAEWFKEAMKTLCPLEAYFTSTLSV